MANKLILTAVNIHNVYQYNTHRDILTKQQWIGTYELNSAIEISVMPRKRLETNEILSDEPAAAVAGTEKGFEKSLSAVKHIAPTAKVIGAINDANSLGQHVIQGNGAEMVTESIGVVGQGGGALVGAEVGANIGVSASPWLGPLGPYAPPIATAIGGSVGALVGGTKMKAWGKQLTGGDSPDLLTHPKSPPNHADIQPTIITKEGYEYALVKVEGKYNWYAIMNNQLMLPNRFSPVMSGEKIAELTTTYLRAAGYETQVNNRLKEMTLRAADEQQRTLRDAFVDKEITYRNQSEQAQNYIKQGKAPNGAELNKVQQDANSGMSIWVHEKDKHRFVYVGTYQNQSIESYYDDKTGTPPGGKIHVDNKGQLSTSEYRIETLPDGEQRYHIESYQDHHKKNYGEKVSQHVENIRMAHAFANELPVKAVQNHSQLADAYVAQAAFIKQIASSDASSDLKSAALSHFNDKAINNIANGNVPSTQLLTTAANEMQNQVQAADAPKVG